MAAFLTFFAAAFLVGAAEAVLLSVAIGVGMGSGVTVSVGGVP